MEPISALCNRGLITLIATLQTNHRILADVPNPPSQQPPGTEGIVTIMGWAKWVALAVLVVALIASGVMFALRARRGDGAEGIGHVGMVLAGVIVVSAAGTLVGFLAGE